MDVKIYTAIACYNRRRLAELCIPTVRDGMVPSDSLVIYDDGSQEKMRESEVLRGVADSIVDCESIGIDAQRRNHILEFHYTQSQLGFTHLYLTDSDSPHSPNWREAALSLQAEHKAPICLYRTQTHADYKNNIFRDVPHENVIWQRFAPGVSYLLTADMVAKVAHLVPEKWSWDWHLPGLFGYKIAVSRVSYCDHIGWHGMHDPDKGIGPERAANPTAWLEGKREEIIHALNASIGPAS